MAGGRSDTGVLNSVEISTADGTFASVAPMSQARADAACIVLPDGRVLVTGGSDGVASLASAEVYNPTKGAWQSLGNMSVARSGHTATATPWGAVLLVGGEGTGAVELFLTNDTFETLGTLATARTGYAIAATTGHKVVIAGGTHGSSVLASIEVYDGDTGKIIPGAAMLGARRNFAATALLDGSILFTGGYAADGSILATSEIFDPEHGTSVTGPALPAARAGHKAAILPSNGRVLLIGGVDENGVTASTDVYTPWTGKFSGLPAMHAARQQMATAPLRRGAVVVSGGRDTNGALSSTEIFAFATLDTDQADYSPGQQATFTGTGWKPGEQVLLQVAAFPLDQHRIEFTGSAQADSTGRIRIAPFNIDRSHAGMRFLATATGSESQAQNVFTDAAENTVTTIDAIPVSSPFNTALAVTGHVQSSGATNPVDSGTVAVSVDGAPPYSTTAVIAVSGNFAASSISSIVPGNHTIAAAYSGGGAPPWNASSASAGYQVTTPTTTTLNSPAAASAPIGTAVVFQATVASPLGAPAPGSGSIEFHDTNGGNVIITTVPVVAGVAQITLSNLPAKTYGVQAVYVPTASSGYSASSSATTTYTVARLSPTVTTTALPASQTVGDLVTLSSCVTTVAGIAPTGTITFNDGAAISGLVPLSGGCASFQYTKLTGGSNTITVVYSGDSNYKFNVIGMGNLVLSVAKAVSFSAATSNPASPVPFGTPVQLLGSVTSPATAANGFLIGGAANGTFQDNGVDIPGCALLTVASGAVACNAPALSVGIHPITFKFLNNDPNFLPSTSPVYNLNITRYAASGALTTIPGSPVMYGTAAIARVQFGPSGGGPALTGSVSFYDGVNLLGSSPVVSGGNTDFAMPNSVIQSVGSHNLTARYGGDANYSAAIAPFPATTLVVNKATPTGSVISTPASPVALGAPLTLTATFTPPAGGTLTGTVNFFDGTTQLNPAGVTIASGQASFSLTSALSAGPHSITAVYSGDANFNSFTTAIYALTVNATATSVSTPTSSAGANYTYGTTTNYTAVVSPHPGAPAFTGTVQFFDGGIAIGAPVVPNASTGSVTSAAILLTAGTHTITAQFAGDGNYLPSASGQLSQNIAKAPSVVSTPILTSGTATPDSSVTFSATASPLSGGGVPTGTITFTIDGGVRPPAAINAGGTASVTATFSAGSHTLSATYSGDSNFLPSSSGTLAQPVSSSNNPSSNSDPKLTVYANPTVPTLGDTVTLLVNVSSDGAVPYGTVQFYDGTTLLATAPVVGGRATQTIPTTSLGNAGSHNITVTYSGDGINNPSSKNFGLLVNRIPLVLSLTSNLSASVYGQAVTFTAKAASPAPPGVSLPSGQVQLVDANGVVATGSMTKGTAVTNVTTLDAGSHQVAASFVGDINWVPAKSTALPQAIAKAQTAVKLAALPDVSGSPQVTVTANLDVALPGGGVPGGTVQFVDSVNNLVLGTAQVVGGAATATLSEPSAGSRTISAIYSGTLNYVDSKSPNVTHISVANAAGYSAYHAAPDEIMSVFGANLASGSASATAVPLPLSLAGTSVKITDQAGVDHTAPLYFAAPNQINLLIPSEVPLGPVRITVTNSNGDTFPIVTAATGTSPGLFAANADGRGIAAAQVIRVFKDGTQTVENVAKLDAAQKLFVPAPISFGNEQLFLTLYGTGIRHTQGQSSVTCTINGQDLPVLFAGAQPTFLGLDQVNVRLPASFAGTGAATVVIRVDGQASNPVTLTFQ